MIVYLLDANEEHFVFTNQDVAIESIRLTHAHTKYPLVVKEFPNEIFITEGTFSYTLKKRTLLTTARALT